MPKNGELETLSAQIPSLSENSAAFWRLTMTGFDQAELMPAAALVRSSVCETAMASNPLNACSLRCAAKFEVRLP